MLWQKKVDKTLFFFAIVSLIFFKVQIKYFIAKEYFLILHNLLVKHYNTF